MENIRKFETYEDYIDFINNGETITDDMLFNKKSYEQNRLDSFKKSLIQYIKVYSEDKLMSFEDHVFSDDFWKVDLDFVKNFLNGDDIMINETTRFEEFVINCIIKYIEKGIDLEITPCFALFCLMLRDERYSFTCEEKEKITYISEHIDI